jgi:hypothetical protein
MWTQYRINVISLKPLQTRFDCLHHAEKGLTRAIRVNIGGIDEVAAGFAKGVIDLLRLVFA